MIKKETNFIKRGMKMRNLKVEQNVIFKDYRVVEYIDGKWENEYDNNWTKKEAIYQKKRMLQGFEPDICIEA
jgi:hypothetical protein